MSTTPVYLIGDAAEVLRSIPEQSVNTCVTSPPYWGLRDFGVDGQIGLEDTYKKYVSELVDVFREVKRVLRKDGTLWLNMGDTYSTGKPKKNYDDHSLGWSEKPSRRRDRVSVPGDGARRVLGLKPKNLIGIPWRVAFALQEDGWYLRSDIIWHKPNPLPGSAKDRPTTSHEYVFLLSRSKKYYYDFKAIMEPAAESSIKRTSQPNLDNQAGSDRIPGRKNGRMKAVLNGTTRNKRSVWTVATQKYSGAHFATYPEKLIEPCILAGCPEGGLVLDSFAGSGTTLAVSRRLGRRSIGIDLNPEYREMAAKRCGLDIPDITEWTEEDPN